ncbi:hypothetical protein [Catenovulum sediminis]|uniref:Big-1 domain-containing protein n=1 Tax=Catenovulum sediminis TaxID=1740262 RepID=A0ABV1RBL8_9ALTE
MTDSGMALTEVGHFDITPGKRIENIQIPTDHEYSETFYLQISAKPQHENPTFGDLGASADGPLQYRPKHYVPFKVPVYDEILDTYRKTQYNALVAAGEQNLTPPETQYQYRYRPEYQFSLLDFELKNFKRQTQDQQVVEINSDKGYMVSSDDVALDILFSISDYQNQNIEPLPFLGVGQQLVLEMGGREVELTLGENQQLTFNNPADLHQLEGEDFLFLQLYDNQDPDNILWEYAFQMLTADTRWAGYDNIGEDGTIYVSADDTKVPLQGMIIGYQEGSDLPSVNWNITEGAVDKVDDFQAEYRHQGVFPADITLTPTVGNRVTMQLQHADDDKLKVTLPTIEVQAGAPATLWAEAVTSEMYVEGHQFIDVHIAVNDQFGNPVQDGTPITYGIDGSAIIDEDTTQYQTTNGIAKARLRGAALAQIDNTLTIQVNDLQQSVPFTVKPLTVVIDPLPQSVEQEELLLVTARVLDDESNLVEGIEVDISATFGKVTEQIAITNEKGEVQVAIHTGFYPNDNAQVVATVGLSSLQAAQTIVNKKPGQIVSTHDALLIGDQLQAGQAQLQRFDGLNVGMDYAISRTIDIPGIKGQSHTLTLGSLLEPNLVPIASWGMHEVDKDKIYALEHNNLHPALINYAEPTRVHPNGVGKSLYFNRNAYLKTEDKDTGEKNYLPSSLSVLNQTQLRPENGLGIRLDMRPGLLKDESSNETFIQKGGMLVDIAGGTQTLKLNDAFELEFTIHNGTGKHIVKSAPLSHDAWYKVAARYYQGQLTLQVNDTTYEQSTDGSDLNYSVTSKGIVIGENYTGHLSRVKIYDWRSQPLVTFADGSIEKTLTYEQDESQTLNLVSTGQLHQQANSEISLVRVGFSQNQYQGFIGVMSLAHYEAVGTQMIATRIFENAPEYTHYNNPYNSNPYVPKIPFISQAHANWVVDWAVDNAYDIVVGAIGFLIPYEETISMFKQVYYLATGDEQFDSMQLTLDTLGVLTVFPLLKPVAPIVKTLRKILPVVKKTNPKFIGALGGVIGKIGKKLMKGDLDSVISIAPFIVLAGQLATDEQMRASLMIMVKTVQSDDDLWAWIEYLNLPADGWEGEGEPPELEIVSNYSQIQYSPAIWGFNQAYAAPPKQKGKTVSSSKFANVLNMLGRLFKNGDDLAANRKILDGIKDVTESAKAGGNIGLRRAAFVPQVVAASSIIGSKLFRRIRENIDNLRMPPLAIAATIMYLESRNVGECHSDFVGCRPLTDQIRDELPKLYRRAIWGFLSGSESVTHTTTQQTGYLFHLAMVAVNHLKYEVLEKRRPIAVETKLLVQLLKEVDGVNRDYGEPYERHVDIVLAGDGEGIPNIDSILVETKSYKLPKKGSIASNWKEWDLKRGKKLKSNVKNHRQFYLDKVAISDRVVGSRPRLKIAADFQWWFQDFKRAPKSGEKVFSYDNDALDKVAMYARELPTEANNIGDVSLGFESKAAHDDKWTVKKTRSHLNMFDLKEWLIKDEGKQLLDGVDEDLIKDLIEYSQQF